MTVQYDRQLTELIHEQARALGADLVGIANVERYAAAPALLSPQGHLPAARSLVVVALAHPDAAVEMGGRPSPHHLGPYEVQNTMNTRNEHIVWVLAGLLEERGWRAIPMPATNIWRFRPYKEVQRPFVPDISNIHAGAAAGLGEIGWSGLLLTPEFGPRQRLCTLITDAPLEPTPVYQGEPLCDRCLMCARHCPTQAFDQEVKGEQVVVIGGRVMRYADKNIWRCAWAEHFGLDLDLPKPAHIDEAVILSQLAQHGRRGGELGCCLRFCLPPQIRHYEPDYTDTVRRRVHTQGTGGALDRPAGWEVQRLAFGWGAQQVAVADEDQCRAAGLALRAHLTDGCRLVAFALPWPAGAWGPQAPPEAAAAVGAALGDLVRFAEYDIARHLERLGYAALPGIGLSAAAISQAVGWPQGQAAMGQVGGGRSVGSVITSAPLPVGRWVKAKPPAPAVWELLQALGGQRWARCAAPAQGTTRKALVEQLFSALPGRVDLLGIASAERLATLAAQLEQLLDLQAMSFVLRDGGPIHGPVQPQCQAKTPPIVKRPADWLAGARSVIVLGARVPATTLARATEPPAEAVGPYAYAVYQARRELRYAAYALALGLEAAGWRATVADDVTGTGSAQANPRGPQPDFRASAFAAVAAGLGQMLHTGAVWTQEYGTACLFISVVTDAPLPPTPLVQGEPPCARCSRPCVRACPTAALGEETLTVELAGQRLSFGKLDWLRCEWAHRYGLVGAEGPRWIGSQTDLPPPPGLLNVDQLAAAFAQLDPLQKHWLCVVEPCVRACHLTSQKS
jgi:epoxyqueuosine reductase